MSHTPELVDPAANYKAISARAQSAMKAADRTGGAIIVAVSKRHDAARIEPALAAGARVFGENRVQEAASKWPALRARYPDIELHLVGALQTNKAKDAVALFDVIQTVDRAKLARAIAAEAERQKRAPRVFVQVNTGEEPQKSGVLPAGADALIAEVRELRLELAGLMCLPPAGDDPAPHFEMLRDMAARHHLPALSMGMSGDFETAIAHGATHIRVGEAIFGPRLPQ